jgi:hypothetical protein
MKNNDDIPATDATEIKQFINHVKQGKLDRGDALLIEKLLKQRLGSSSPRWNFRYGKARYCAPFIFLI